MSLINSFSNWLCDYTNIYLVASQSFLLYIMYLLLKSRNIFYTLMYFFLMLIFLGIFICFYQLELFTGFLWVAEFSVVLVFLILIIYLNTDGYVRHTEFFSLFKYSYTIIFAFIICYLNYSTIATKHHFLFDYVCLWDNFYEALSNTNVNDFNGLFISYYLLNSFEFLLFAFLLLIGTFICVLIFRSFYSYKVVPYASFFSLFNFFNMKINYNFFRQQNLHRQTSAPAVNRVMRRKK